jgi:hypothetical protein
MDELAPQVRVAAEAAGREQRRSRPDLVQLARARAQQRATHRAVLDEQTLGARADEQLGPWRVAQGPLGGQEEVRAVERASAAEGQHLHRRADRDAQRPQPLDRSVVVLDEAARQNGIGVGVLALHDRLGGRAPEEAGVGGGATDGIGLLDDDDRGPGPCCAKRCSAAGHAGAQDQEVDGLCIVAHADPE